MSLLAGSTYLEKLLSYQSCSLLNTFGIMPLEHLTYIDAHIFLNFLFIFIDI